MTKIYNLYHEFLVILIFFTVSLCIALVISLGGKILSILTKTKNPNLIKNSPFECGFSEFENARGRFDIRFYLVAILFLIFDLEVSFMIPWGIIIRKDAITNIEISWTAFISMMIFLLVLLVGFIYEWKKGALDWK